MTSETPEVVVFVDPQCPFAWITYQWLRKVEQGGAATIDLRLMSLACVNEDQDIDPDYRQYNDDAWAAARVAAALLTSDQAERWPEFYNAYGHRRHVEGERDNAANITKTLAELVLPSELRDAANDPLWDEDLHIRTTEAVAGVEGPGGTPITRIAERAYFGPVLTSIPSINESVPLWHALVALATTPGFASIATRRSEVLDTGQ